MPILRSTLHCHVRTVTESPIENQKSKIDNCLDFLSSDATLDRYSEIISPAGWNLSTYLRNPVFQNAHQYGDIIHTLGKALLTEIRTGPPLPGDPPLRGGRRATDDGSPSASPLPSDGRGATDDGSPSASPFPSDGRGARGEGTPSLHLSSPGDGPAAYLFQRIQFAVDANPLAKIAYALYSGGFLHAVSVGFIPIRWQDNPDDTASPLRSGPPPGGATATGTGPSLHDSTAPSLRSSSARRTYLEQELLEVSAVAIPANPNALALAFKSGALTKSDLADTADLIKYTLDPAHRSLTPPAPSIAIPSPGAPRGMAQGEANHQLLQLARHLRDLMKHF